MRMFANVLSSLSNHLASERRDLSVQRTIFASKERLQVAYCVCTPPPPFNSPFLPFAVHVLTFEICTQIACVSPLPQDGSETINTLRYAMRAKKVKTNPIVRMVRRWNTVLRNLSVEMIN